MIFQRAKGQKIEGRKSMSRDVPLVDYQNPDVVYIHLLQQQAKLKPLVEVGDKVTVGQPVAMREGFGAMPRHATVSGEVTAIKKAWHASGRMVDAIEITNDHKDTFHTSVKKEKNPHDLSKEKLIEKMKNGGLSGFGGAGFPTYVKYQTDAPIDTVIINAVECEPYMTCDYHGTIEFSKRLVKGLGYMMKAAGAQRGVIALKFYNGAMREAVEPFLEDNMETFKVKDIYPSGWEKYIVEQVTNKTYDNLPSEAGVIVNNSGTAIVYSDMVEENIPLIRRALTITGENISEPKNFFVRLGTKVSDLIEKAGGYVDGLDPMETHYIAGGPMTGNAILIDDLIVNDTLGSVIVKPKPEEETYPECLGCGKCADVCPVYLAPTSIWQAYEAKNTDLIKKLNATKCMNCGLCSYVCPSHIEITDYVDKAKTLLKREG